MEHNWSWIWCYVWSLSQFCIQHPQYFQEFGCSWHLLGHCQKILTHTLMEYFCHLSWILVSSIFQILLLQLVQFWFSQEDLNTLNLDLVCDLFSIKLVGRDSKGDSMREHSCASRRMDHSMGILPWLAEVAVGHQKWEHIRRQMVWTSFPSAHW